MLPPLGLDRLWVTSDGRIKLLDWPAPDGETADTSPARGAPTPSPVPDLQQAERLLHLVATSALPEGQALPLRAGRLLEELAAERIGSASLLHTTIAAAVAGPTEVSRARRALHLGLTAMPPVWTALSLWLVIAFVAPLFRSSEPTVFTYMASLQSLQDFERRPDSPEVRAEREALEIDIAVRFQQFLSPGGDSARTVQALPPGLKALAERVKAKHPSPSPDEVRRARSTLALVEARHAAQERMMGRLWPFMVLLMSVFFGFIGCVFAVAARGGLLLRMLGIAVVDRSSREAARWRCGLRALVAWLPIFAPFLIRMSVGYPVRLWMVVLSVTVFLAGAAYAIANPVRSVQDRIVGTRLVPR
jgi:hypothetical protein